MARNLITEWSKTTPGQVGFDVLESSGASIISAIVTSDTGYKYIRTNAFTIAEGDSLRVTLDITHNTGTLLYIGIARLGASGWISNLVQLVNEANVAVLVATAGATDAAVWIEGKPAVNFSTGEVVAIFPDEIKYQLLCTGKNGVESRLVIYKDGYLAAELDRNIPMNPFRLRKDESEVVCGSSMEFGIREAVDFEFVEFYTNSPQMFKVEYYYPADTLIWSGFINPQQYSGDYKPAPNNLFFQATDGLGLLKNQPFTLTGFNSELTILRHCLAKTGLLLGFAIAIDIWEITHDTTRSPLAQTFIDAVVFSGLNCYEVIEAILGMGKYDATITQWNNRWSIVSYKDKKATRMLYSAAGVYETTEAAQALQELVGQAGSGDQVWPANILRHSLTSGGKGIALSHDFGRKLSLLDGYDFNLYASAMFTYWTKSGTFVVIRAEDQEGSFYAYLAGYSNVDSDYIVQQIPIENAVGDDFVFEFDFAPVGYLFTSSTGATPISMAMRVLVTLTVGATVYYLTADGWGTTPAYITQTISSSVGVPIFTHLKIMTSGIPGNGTLEVRLMRYKNTPPGGGSSVVYRGMAFANILTYFLDNNQLYPSKFEDVAMFDGSTEPEMLDEIDVLVGDAPDLENNTQLYVNIARLSDRTPTLTWGMGDDDTDFSILGLFIKMLASRNIYPRQTLEGEIKGANLGFESLIRHAYNSNREFEIVTCEWDVYSGRWTVKLREWFSFTDREVTFESGVEMGGPADLTVATVVPASYAIRMEGEFNTTVHIDNTGESTGRQRVQWQIIDGSDDVISSGIAYSGSIPAGQDSNLAIAMVAPEDAGTYYVRCRVITDTAWVTSLAIVVSNAPSVTLNSVASIDNGVAGAPMTVTFNATNYGGAGDDRVYWQNRDSGGVVMETGYEDITFAEGSGNYSLTEVNYPVEGGAGCDLQIGLSALVMDLTSNDFDVT
jgi:hypothetical protein